MLVTIPFATFMLSMLYLVIRGSGYRQALLGAAICCGLLVTAATELLSLFSALSAFSLALFWGGTAILALLLTWPVWDLQKLRPLRLENQGLLAGIAVVLAMTLAIALIAPPNNWDSMTYHMARVVHWIQNGSVAHYPTHVTRQLYSAPWAEYAIMHLQLLSGGDRYANLVQWCAMVGSIAGTSLIAGEMGASGRIQALAAVVTATIPMGILQASSTQNDYVTALWLVCFVYWGLVAFRTRQTLPVATGCVCLGLALLTKGTAYIFALPFLLWILFVGPGNDRKRLAKQAILASVIVISLNSGHLWRNFALWGNPLATDGERLANERISIGVAVSNLTRNMVSHTWTPLSAINQLQFRSVALVHAVLDSDISEPATSFNGELFLPGRTSLDEDYAGNALHLLLAILAVVSLAVRRESVPRRLLYYTLALAGGFLLFCLLLKWQPWGTRLQLPLFVLAAPLLVMAFPLERIRAAVPVYAAFMLLCAVPWLMGNQTRPLWGERSILNTTRESLYFAKRPALESYYRHYVDRYLHTDSCKVIAITSASGNAYEYPFWVLLDRRTTAMPRIEHINVSNITSQIPRRSFQPCFLFEML